MVTILSWQNFINSDNRLLIATVRCFYKIRLLSNNDRESTAITYSKLLSKPCVLPDSIWQFLSNKSNKICYWTSTGLWYLHYLCYQHCVRSRTTTLCCCLGRAIYCRNCWEVFHHTLLNSQVIQQCITMGKNKVSKHNIVLEFTRKLHGYNSLYNLALS